MSAVGQDPRRQRQLGSPRSSGEVRGEKQQKEVMPAAPPKASPFPRFPGQGAAQAGKGLTSLNWGQSYVSRVFVILRHGLRQKCFSYLVAPKGDCWSGSHMHP